MHAIKMVSLLNYKSGWTDGVQCVPNLM